MTQSLLSDPSRVHSIVERSPTRADETSGARALPLPLRAPERRPLRHDGDTAETLIREHFSLESDTDDAVAELWEQGLAGPVAEFLARPSKRFRARLVALSWQLTGNTDAPPPELGWIVEALHAGSLIVDDIEDGSPYRRGTPAMHCAHGLPLALNAGNWLYFWPSALIARMSLPAAIELGVHRALGRTLLACHEGQALDLCARVTDLEQARVHALVHATTRLKTGKLLELCAVLGATVAGASPQRVQALGDFGEALGCGLQMLDDVGGILSAARAHKGHEDLINARPTWPWAWAAEELSSANYQRLSTLGREVANREVHPELLAERFRELLGEGARARVSAHLSQALSRLRRSIGPSASLSEVERELERLEASYG